MDASLNPALYCTLYCLDYRFGSCLTESSWTLPINFKKFGRFCDFYNVWFVLTLTLTPICTVLLNTLLRGASPFKLPNFYEKSEENMDQGSSRVDLFVLPGFPSLSPVSVHVVSLSVS